VSGPDPARPARRAREKHRRGLVRPLLVVLLTALAFLLGIAFARTLDERPSRGDTVTTVGTLPPISEGATHTVTVTVTAP